MKIQYEIGDTVFMSIDYGGYSYTVVKVHSKGVTVENSHGERFYFGCRQIEPTPMTVQNASWIT